MIILFIVVDNYDNSSLTGLKQLFNASCTTKIVMASRKLSLKIA